MKQSDHNPKQARKLSARLGAVAAALLCLGLLAASPASAAYEQVGNFAGTPGALQLGGGTPDEVSARWPEEVQLGGVGGLAVNHTGAGGVPKGTLYAATFGEGMRVVRFNPDGSFSEAWTFNGSPPQERCGPEGDPAHPVCDSQPRGSAYGVDVDIDQSTGYVYVINGVTGFPAGTNLIHVYSPDGSELISEFGDQAPEGDTSESPEKIHESGFPGGIAVDAAGKVYAFDENRSDNFYSRLMVFEPQSPGDYKDYVYAGQSHDIAAGSKTIKPALPVTDSAGDVYVASSKLIAKLDPSQPSAPPLCEFKFPKGQIESITVNPESGEVFFFTFADKKIHQLAPCDEAEGKFAEVGTFGFSPLRSQIGGLALNPTRGFSAGRPFGTLYAGTPGYEGGKTEGEPPNNKVESSLGYIFAPPVELAPEVISESAAHVSATTADLGAQINPKGPPTHYVFQYLTQAEYEANEPADRFAGAVEAPLGGALLGEGPNPLSAAASLTGLAPGTTYYYRVVATNHCSAGNPGKVCEGVGLDQSFNTFLLEAPGLPDRRAYELVSPVEKQGGQVLPADPTISSCKGGCSKPGVISTHFPMQSRPDGEAIAYEGTPFSGDEGAVYVNQYIAHRDAKTGWETSNPTPPQLQGRGEGFGYKAFDTQLTRGVLEQGKPVLSPEAPAGYENLYTQQADNPLGLGPFLTVEPPNRLPGGNAAFQLNYAGGSADLSRVFFQANDALTGETPFAPEAVDGGASKYNLYEWAAGQLRLVNVMPGNSETKPGASFGAGSANSISTDGSRVFWSDESGQVYVRENAETSKAIPDAGKFLSAATDGSKVLLANGHLYDLEGETNTDLSEGKGGFEGILGQSDDLSRVYFVDTAVLSEEENEQKAKAQAGKPNLYAWSEGEGVRFVTTLAGDGDSASSDWASSSTVRTAEASPDGRWVAFLSQARLTGYDNTGPCSPDPSLTGPCREAFLYDFATGELSCPSCNPSGTRPLGLSVLRRVPGAPSPSVPQPRYLTDEGRLYFDSRDSLSPFDTNEGAEDVYQYEPDGVGSCTRGGGCVTLISAGSEPSDSNFFAMDESGKNVFFTSRDQLVLKDTDDLIDLYVAREDGGIPGETEVARGECQGEACVPQISPPNDPTPGSSTFEGAGNVDEKKAAKKHAKKHKKAHKKKHTKKHAHKRAAKHNRGGTK